MARYNVLYEELKTEKRTPTSERWVYLYIRKLFLRGLRNIAKLFGMMARSYSSSDARSALARLEDGTLHIAQSSNDLCPSLKSPLQIVEGSPMHDHAIGKFQNLVTWTLSGQYDNHRPILIDASEPTRYVSKATASYLVSSLAGAFRPGSTVCLHLANDVLYPVLVLSILASRCQWTGTNPAYTASELCHHFGASETAYVITEEHDFATVQNAVNRAGREVEIVVFEDLLRDAGERLLKTKLSERPPTCEEHSERYRTLSQLLHEPVDLERIASTISPRDIAALNQTSGTTGLPKMAARSHRSMIAEQAAIEDNNRTKRHKVRRLFCTPVFHAFSAPEMIFNILRLGQTSYFMRRFDDTFAQKVHDFGITETFGAPPMFLRLVDQPGAKELLQSMKVFYFGGAPLAPSLRQRMLDLYDGQKPRIVPVYGMTEGGWFTTLRFDEDDATGSSGRPLPGYELTVASQSDANTSGGQQIGEIMVRGPQLMSGYLNNPQATTDAFEAGGWLKTGDIGYLKDGKVYLIDRAKDMIKVNGWQVSPVEIENALTQHRHIHDAGVVGAGEDVNEHPIACIVADKRSLTVGSVKAHLKELLASYKVSKTEVRFVETIPKNPSGKILRRQLKEMVTVPVA